MCEERERERERGVKKFQNYWLWPSSIWIWFKEEISNKINQNKKCPGKINYVQAKEQTEDKSKH